MKAILKEKDLPKLLVVNEMAEKSSHNKHLLMPWKKGEIVKVLPFEEQKRFGKYDHLCKYVVPNDDPDYFRKRYVRVMRKDDHGKWSLIYTASWDIFNTLNKKSK